MRTASRSTPKERHSIGPLQRRPLHDAIQQRLLHSLGRTIEDATLHDWYFATALAVRDQVTERWLDARNRELGRKRVYYLSIEFLLGRLLFDTLINLDLLDEARDALAELGVDIEKVKAVEPDAALGNGGLGRLAACYLDSMAAVGIAGEGYGVRYEFGLFEQQIRDGWQKELPETWLRAGNPWELRRPDKEYRIGFGGSVEYIGGDRETACAIWWPDETVIATRYDVPVAGWRGKHFGTLRLWGAHATDPIALTAFNEGDHIGAMLARDRAEAITRVLYPDDSTPAGQELRLRQEYFFTAASLRDIVRRHLEQFGDIRALPQHAAIQLNDTHPAIAVAELMRILVDEHEISWHDAWDITRGTFSYTNHTLLPEALETWPIDLFGRVLPRHLQIIYLINWLHLKSAAERGFSDPEFLERISLIQETGQPRIRMAHLAFSGSHTVNGVSALHTELLKQTIFRDLLKVTPTKLINQTNGITFRRWLLKANPTLTSLLVRTIGPRFLDDPEQLGRLTEFVDDSSFADAYAKVRLQNKVTCIRQLPDYLAKGLDPAALFDIQIKRIHEYKRQLLNILEAAALYLELREGGNASMPPRVKIIAGKAASSYERAKLIIKLAHDVARNINNDPLIGERLKLIFVPNYNVSLAEILIPAGDLSEQISTAGMEASGTGNMKLALNGALTIGTLDGANIEIRERVGADNFFLFGMTADEVSRRKQEHFEGRLAVEKSPRLKAAVDAIASGAFSEGDRERYAALIDALLGFDPFMVAADFDAYWEAQRTVDRVWQDPERWRRAAILNTAHMGFFSSDRAVKDYAREVWRTPLG